MSNCACPTEKSKIMVHGLIRSHIDFCNGLFSDIPAYQVDRLQNVQTQAARIKPNSPPDQPSTEILKTLHWLPVRARFVFKILWLFSVLSKERRRQTWDLCSNVFRDITAWDHPMKYDLLYIGPELGLLTDQLLWWGQMVECLAKWH